MPHWFHPNHWFDFDAPQFLLLFVVLPAFWLIGRRSLSALGSWRRHLALALRMTVAAIIIATLAEPNWLTRLHRVSVMFLVDASDSVDETDREQALRYVNRAVEQRDASRGDLAGVIVFGREAATEVPPLDGGWVLSRIESEVDPNFTNLEAALNMAAATLPHDTAKRVVVVSDGNENMGDAARQASRLLHAGIGIDVVPIHYHRRGDVVVEKVVTPPEIRPLEPFSVTIVLNNLSPEATIRGRIRLTRERGGNRTVVVEEPVSLPPGKHARTVRQELEDSGLTTFEALFLPDEASDDAQRENNSATSFSTVVGRGHVLLVEDADEIGGFANLARILRNNEIRVTLRDNRRPFDNLQDLQQFDAVILADVPRHPTGGENVTLVSDNQIRQLAQNTEHFGSGLIVIGGPNSFGAGGWTGTELEKALPVNFQIDAAKVQAVGALVLVIDSSGSMSGEKIKWSKAAAQAAAGVLGQRDFIGVVSFDSEAHWVFPLQRNGIAERTRAMIGQLAAGGGTNLMPALSEAYRALQGADAAMKHVIVLTDGNTPPDDYGPLVSQMRERGITTTGVAIGPDADRLLLSNISQWGNGKFYHVQSPNAIPRIFMNEARRVARPLIFEDPNGFAVQRVRESELLGGIESLPPITGYVLTTVKENPLVEVLLATPRQPHPQNAILASWNYGIGRAAAWTTDAGKRWTKSWQEWESQEKLFLQLVRWAMRRHDASARYTLATNLRDGTIHFVVNAIDPDNAAVSEALMRAIVVKPNGESESVDVRQTMPGRYTGQIPAYDSGNYFFAISDGGDPLRAAIHAPRSSEFRALESNEPLLFRLAEGTPQGGERGAIISASGGLADTNGLLATNVFRSGLAPAQQRDAKWPVLLVVAAAVFVVDVLCRRVVPSWDWFWAIAARLPWLRNDLATSRETAPMERLKTVKVGATARFEGAQRTAMQESEPMIDTDSTQRLPPTESESGGGVPESDEEVGKSDFTTRLLETKWRIRKDR